MGEKRKFYTFRRYQMMKQSKKLLTASMEDYLEMIYRDCLQHGYTRVNAIAKQLNVKASSVSKTVQKLAKLGLVNYEKYGIIQLTQKGENIGNFLLTRHKTIEAFLNKIGVKKMALRDTEMIEHHISLETYENIEMLNDFLDENPDVIKNFNKYKKKTKE